MPQAIISPQNILCAPAHCNCGSGGSGGGGGCGGGCGGGGRRRRRGRRSDSGGGGFAGFGAFSWLPLPASQPAPVLATAGHLFCCLGIIWVPSFRNTLLHHPRSVPLFCLPPSPFALSLQRTCVIVITSLWCHTRARRTAATVTDACPTMGGSPRLYAAQLSSSTNTPLGRVVVIRHPTVEFLSPALF